MFNWLGNLFPYSDLHSLNLDWILSKMKETAAQATKAVADAANALAQVAEAKAAALSAQTAAQNAQTAANKAQTAADNAADSAENAVSVAQAAKSAAQTAQNTANTAQSAAQTAQNTANTAQSAAETAQSAAQTAQNTANTAQSAAQTAQSAAQTAQSKAETANDGINTLNSRFPIKNSDIADSAVDDHKLRSKCVTLDKLFTADSYLYKNTTTDARFPRSGNATIDQIISGIEDTYSNRLSGLQTQFLHVDMDIKEDGDSIPNTVFTCSSPVIAYTSKTIGICAIAPIIVIKNDTNDVYHGFIKLSQHYKSETDTVNLKIKCEVIFNSAPPFNANTKFVITANPVSAELGLHA